MHNIQQTVQEFQDSLMVDGIDSEDGITLYNILNKLKDMSSEDLKDADLALAEIVHSVSVYSL